MVRKLPSAAALVFAGLLAACVEPVATTSASAEIARLQAFGYRVTAQSEAGGTTVLRYSGPINASVACRRGGAAFQALSPRIQASDGTRQEFELNAYLILNAGSDGVLSASERDGLYVVSKTTRPPGNAPVTDIESITFGPTSRASFPSGLACRAA